MLPHSLKLMHICKEKEGLPTQFNAPDNVCCREPKQASITSFSQTQKKELYVQQPSAQDQHRVLSRTCSQKGCVSKYFNSPSPYGLKMYIYNSAFPISRSLNPYFHFSQLYIYLPYQVLWPKTMRVIMYIEAKSMLALTPKLLEALRDRSRL